MTRQTDITSDIDKSKNHTNSTMLTGCFFDNNDPSNKKKIVFDCSSDETPIKDLLETVLAHGKTWVSSD